MLTPLRRHHDDDKHKVEADAKDKDEDADDEDEIRGRGLLVLALVANSEYDIDSTFALRHSVTGDGCLKYGWL